ncbi:hypothetical protein H310_01619 [Aphanomyces invadans]|uniref:EF-hand domain-containing protein n=1 Tax=Aphanomyces invadans TaxID=157072 RepID=A0A024UU46_9STRA|nr:hypothetical protein H310_01619 [Aphanomyces invadans]ETW09193.1 hypothetical protein H310_01619 [Aphanomyces invadans]|eukprot:XP_008862998.1 hypothetical protein H310_01619 [Aphanomyces invadans]
MATRQEVFYFEEIVDGKDGPLDGDEVENIFTLSECKMLNDDIQLPAKRGGATLTAVTSAQGKTLLYLIGGANRAAEAFGDVHVLDWETMRWNQAKPLLESAPFIPRSGHTAVAWGSRIFVFGGANLRIDTVFNDLHVLDTVQMKWLRPIVGGDVPPPRNSHVAVATAHGMVVIGGSSPQVGAMNDVYLLPWPASDGDALRWRRIYPTSTLMSKRELHSACVDGDRILVVGGRSSSGQLCSDLCVLNTDSWTWTITPLPAWQRCAHASGVVGRTRWLHFGGWEGGQDFLSDCWELSLDSSVQSSPACASTSTSRERRRGYRDTSICQMRPVPLQLVVGQPKDPSTCPNQHVIDVAFMDPEETATGLAGRFAHCACVVDESTFVVFGGMTPEADLNDVWVLECNGSRT